MQPDLTKKPDGHPKLHHPLGHDLRASHILPWSLSTPEQKVDPNNGLLLAVNLDAAFDRHLISFDKEGCIVIADAFALDEAHALGIHQDMRLRSFTAEHQKYLQIHRDTLAVKWGAKRV